MLPVLSMSILTPIVTRLQSEKVAWEALHHPLPLSPPLPPQTSEQPPPTIDPLLLDSPEQARFLSLLSQPLATSATTTASSSTTSHPPTSLTRQTTTQLQSLASTLEFNVDRFADGIHALAEYQRMGERVAGRALGLGAERLEERSRRERGAGTGGEAEVGTKEVLRALGEVLKR